MIVNNFVLRNNYFGTWNDHIVISLIPNHYQIYCIQIVPTIVSYIRVLFVSKNMVTAAEQYHLEN